MVTLAAVGRKKNSLGTRRPSQHTRDFTSDARSANLSVHEEGDKILLTLRTSTVSSPNKSLPYHWKTIFDSASSEATDSLEELRLAFDQADLKFRTLIEQMPDAIAVYRHGRFVYVNSALCAALGYDDSDDLIGMTLLDLIHPDDRQRARERVEEMMEIDESVPPAKLRFFRRDDSLLPVEVHDQPIVFEGESAFAVVARDISRQEEFLARAMQVERKLAVGTLASGAAHEINNPLSIAKANIDFVLHQLKATSGSADGTIEADKIADMVDALTDSSCGLERIGTIVSELRTFVDDHDGQRAPVDVKAVLETTLNLAHRQNNSPVQVVRELRALPQVRANRAQLTEAFVNVLTNAMQSFGVEALEPKLGIDPKLSTDEVRISAACVNDQVTVTISDTGCGISEEVLIDVLDPFFSTRDEGSGTGLGLTIARNTLENFGGGIDIDSTLGEGTTVKMWLPAIDTQDTAEIDPPTQPVSLMEDTTRDEMPDDN
jgi:two-component system sporulation sensor kinase A